MIETARRRFGRRIAVAAACVLPRLVFGQAKPDALVLRCPGPPHPSDTRAGFYLELLDLVMQKTGAAYRLDPRADILTGAQVLERLPEQHGLDVAWGTDTPEWEEKLWPVTTPVDKGILGWRLLLIRRRDRHKFAAIRTHKELAALLAGQQRDWSDVAVLLGNGLRLAGYASYEELFPALAEGRYQYLPRGIAEIWDEEKRFGRLGLMIEPTLALHYRQQSHFFVSRKNPLLHGYLEQGMHMAIADGSYETLFDRYNGEAIRRANLDARRVFELKMPA